MQCTEPLKVSELAADTSFPFNDFKTGFNRAVLGLQQN